MNRIFLKVFLIILIMHIHLISQDDWTFYPDSSTIGIFVCDFITGSFESSGLKNFSECNSAGNINSLPLNYNSVDSSNGMRIDVFSHECTNEVFLSASILPNDVGKIKIPEFLFPSDSFSIGDTNIDIKIPQMWLDPSFVEADYPDLGLVYENAWDSINNLKVINKFAESKFFVCIYFYTPFLNNYENAKTIVFVYRPSQTETALKYTVDSTKNINYFETAAFPNPFNPSTTIRYILHIPSQVKIDVFNSIGQKILTLFNKYMSAGVHDILFNAKDLPNGIYLCKIEAEKQITIIKMVLLK